MNTQLKPYTTRGSQGRRVAILDDDTLGIRVGVRFDPRRRPSRRWHCSIHGQMRTPDCDHVAHAAPLVAESLGLLPTRPA